jgi:hypothetical protein
MTKRSVLQIKLFICVLMLTAAIGFMVHLLWPRLGLLDMGLYVLAGWGLLVGLFLLLVADTAISGWINQWVLRKGGTDTQWLWFPDDPKGLARQKKLPSD